VFFAQRVKAGKRKRRRQGQLLQFPAEFSFIENPDETIETIETLVAHVLAKPHQIMVDQRGCTSMDLCAEAVLNACVRIARRRHRCRWVGWRPLKPEVQEIARATGITRELGIEKTEDLPSDIYYFDLVQGRMGSTRSRESSECEVRASELIEYINRCLKRYDKQLTDGGQKKFADMIAEVINNCEDHSGRAEWWVSAYLRQPPGKQYGDLHIAIFNLGDTIADTLQRLPPESEIRGDIEKLIAHHRRVGSLDARYTEEALWTICALQSGVSSKNVEADQLGHRGSGTVRLMDAFFRLGQVKDGSELPKMALVSGRTHIVFDGRYPLRTLRTSVGEERKVITFNNTSLNDPPDPSCVRKLERFFPGTVLSFRFFLDQKHLDSVPEYAADHRSI
jgi:hypothetical protein